MGAFSTILSILSLLIAIISILVYFTIPTKPEAPSVNLNNWFGKGNKQLEDKTIHPFQISVTQEHLEDLKVRLQKTRLVDNLEGAHWEYGTNKDYLEKLLNYWINDYNWNKQEKLLNSFPNFKTNIDGLKVHFLHIKPQLKANQVLVPIIFIHGWPGSFYEFYKVIQILSKESVTGKFAYEMICPSIPGYGFSEAAHKPGLNVLSTAVIFSKLMARLGHTLYYAQGGDWGSIIARTMSVVDKKHVKGLHLNFFPVSAPYGLFSYAAGYFTLPQEERNRVLAVKDYYINLLRESGYFHLQATRPDSVGVGLADSPAGLASYITEKFFAWSGCRHDESVGCLDSRFKKDEILTNIMIYWVTNSITSSMRFYKEYVPYMQDLSRLPVEVPSGLAAFKYEMLSPPKSWALATFTNNVHFSAFSKGGHFAALEQPELFADDVVQFVTKVEAI